MTTFKVGDEAVILRYSGAGEASAARVTVTRVGKRDIGLSDGSRFDAVRLKRTPSGAWVWAPVELLVRPDDPRVAKVDEEEKQWRANYRAHRAFDSWCRGVSNPTLARALADAATELADHLDAQDRSVAQQEGGA